jgi:AcrR family transcriptional regulator
VAETGSITMRGERARAAILDAGLALWPDVTARGVGKALKMTHAGVFHHYPTTAALKDAVAAEAVRIGDERVIRQLIVTGHPAADSLGQADRARYLAGC